MAANAMTHSWPVHWIPILLQEITSKRIHFSVKVNIWTPRLGLSSAYTNWRMRTYAYYSRQALMYRRIRKITTISINVKWCVFVACMRRQHGGDSGAARATAAGGVGWRLAGAARQAHAAHAARAPAQARPTGRYLPYCTHWAPHRRDPCAEYSPTK